MLSLVLFFCVLFAGGEDSKSKAGPRATRFDLAKAYLRFERRYRQFPPPPERTAAFNRSFDQAAFLFFSGRFAEAVQRMNDLGAELVRLNGSTIHAADVLAGSLQVDVEPRVLSRENKTLRIRVRSMYSAKFAADDALKIRGLSSDGRELWSRPLSQKADPSTSLDFAAVFELGSLVADLPIAGEIVVASGDGTNAKIADWYYHPEPIEVVRARNERRINELKIDDRLLGDKRSLQARNNLLVSKPAATSSAQFLADPLRLARDVETELALLAAGKSPYYRKPGDYWTIERIGSADIPMRVYAPPELLQKEKESPLVIVLHGAGGDESMFFDGYGDGRIKQLAQERGFVVASPQSYAFSLNPDLAPGLIDALAAKYAVDRKRVYLLGHSMGAGATSVVLGKHGRLFASACCLAGLGPVRGDIPPTLVVAAGLDELIPSTRIEQGVKTAQARHLPVEFRVIQDYGHVLIVNHYLPEAIGWMLEKTAR